MCVGNLQRGRCEGRFLSGAASFRRLPASGDEDRGDGAGRQTDRQRGRRRAAAAPHIYIFM